MTDDLDDLLADLARAATTAAARGTLGGDAPASVHRITTRVRRRRAARQTGQGLAAACAAGVLVAGGVHVRDVLRTPLPVGVPTTEDPATPDTSTVSPAPTDDPTARESALASLRAKALASQAANEQREAELAATRAAAEAARAAAAVFRCGEPAPASVHALPDAHGLLLAADDDLTAQVSGVAQLTWHASLPTAARFAILGDDGTVVAQLVEDDDTRTRVDGTAPEQTYRLTGGLHVVGCEGEPDVTSGETVTAWPYVSADVYSSDTDTTPTPVVVIAEPREITIP